jgi:hypothetical protein
VFATLALLSKEQGITALVVAGAYDVFIHQKLTPYQLASLKTYRLPELSSLLRRGATLAAVFIVLLGARFSINGSGKPIFNEMEIPAAFAEPTARWLTQNYYVVFNLKQLTYPFKLCHDWSHNSIPLVESVLDVRCMQTGLLYGGLALALRWLCSEGNYGCFVRSML